jgi:hypothetical protein
MANPELLPAIITGGSAVLAALIGASVLLVLDRRRFRDQRPTEPSSPPQEPTDA